MSETKRKGKDLLNYLQAAGKTEYGSVITGTEVRGVLGLEYPEVASKKTFDQLALQELSATDYVRNVLLGEGKYFGQHQGDYRVLLPSQNADQIRRYMESADGKLRRGLKLWRSTPVTDSSDRDNLGARILLKREGIKSRSVLGDN
jgi:hypothetical protein